MENRQFKACSFPYPVFAVSGHGGGKWHGKGEGRKKGRAGQGRGQGEESFFKQVYHAFLPFPLPCLCRLGIYVGWIFTLPLIYS